MLFELIKKDRIQAMKDKDTLKRDLLGTLIGEASKQVKDPTDESVTSTIKKFIKNDEDTIKLISDNEAISILNKEITILESYLPKQLTEKEIIEEISVLIFGHQKFALKDVMTHFKDNFSGKYDGSVVSRVAKELISKG